MTRSILCWLPALVLATGLTACGDERSEALDGDDVIVTPTIKVNTPAEIVQESADNYDQNVNGLITHNTLKRWIDNWEVNRPAGITGKLVILQAAAGPAGAQFIKPDNRNVFTYVEDSWREARSNGVITIGGSGPGGIVLSGQGIDNLLRRYGIDVQNDLIVCAQGGTTNATGNYQNQGRCWYTFRYWGVDQKNVAVLNGNNWHLAQAGQLGPEYFTATRILPTPHPSPIINRQVSSVKDLPVDNTALYASLEDLINVLPATDSPDHGDGVFLWDGRNLPQFSAGLASWSGGLVQISGGHTYASFQNNAPRQSHPRGSFHLEFSNLLDIATGIYYDKATLRGVLNGELSPSNQGFVVGGIYQDYQHVGVGNAWQPGDLIYHFCETSARSGTTLITAAVILGIPSRLYDSGLVEWNSLTANVVDKNGNSILPASSPWDTSGLSFPWFPNQQASINPRSPAGWAAERGIAPENVTDTPLITNPLATHTQQVVLEDRAYKGTAGTGNGGNGGGGSGGGGSGGGGGGGVVLPPNPCGG